eukprot:7907321-Ditylum_brightwellii.AAC.1
MGTSPLVFYCNKYCDCNKSSLSIYCKELGLKMEAVFPNNNSSNVRSDLCSTKEYALTLILMSWVQLQEGTSW